MALLSLALACGTEPDRPGRTLRLDLQPEPGAPQPVAQRLALFEFAHDLPAWSLQVPNSSLRPAGSGGPPRLQLRAVEADGDLILERAGEFPVDRINRLRLVTSFQGSGWLLASVLRDGRAIMHSEVVHLEQSSEPYAAEVDLLAPRALGAGAVGDTLRVVLRGANRNAGLLFVELEQAPLADRLPDPAGAPAMIIAGAQGRSGEGLVSGRDLFADVLVPEGAELRCALVQPGSLMLASAPASLDVSLSTEGGEPEMLWAGELQPSEAWQQLEVGLDAYAGRRVRLRFSLRSQGEAAWGLAEAAIVVPGQRPPPVLLITSDTHRGDHVGALDGRVQVATPALDRLAEGGVLFSQAWSPTNSTNPAHVALMTGMHPRDTGIVVNRRPLNETASTLAERFAEAGYVTYAVLSTKHLGHEGSGLGQGFDRMIWAPNKPLRAERSVDQLLEWLPEADGRPLFVWFHAFDAHWPYDAPDHWTAREYPDDRDPFDERFLSDPAPPSDAVLPREIAGLRDLEFPRAAYRAEVRYLDAQLERLLQHSRFDEAIVALVGDHGEALGEQDVFFDHAGLTPGSLHVPLMLAGPGVPVGVRSDTPLSPLGLGRTLLDLAGLPDLPFPGESLLQELDRSGRQRPLFQLGASSRAASVRFGRHLLVMALKAHHPRPSVRGRELHQVELYDVQADPDCLHDLAELEPELAAELRARLIDWLALAPARGLAGGATEDPELLEQLAELGYVDHDPDAGTTSLFVDDDCAWCQRFPAR
ncbi:MAG: hypothetical protein DHS20C15_05850 [Planctomycetota bacterium]|nr:MAG: hypothetical protein DHS20C15_05850 [Planctomycetota bacterium]